MRVSATCLALSAALMLCSCFGTFHSARVVPFSGGLQAMTVDGRGMVAPMAGLTLQYGF